MNIKKEGNSISFKSSIINRRIFKTILSTFAFATTLIFRIRDRIKIQYTVSLLIAVSSTIRARRTKILTGLKMIGQITSTIRAMRTKVVISIRETVKNIFLNKYRLKINALLKGVQRALSTIKINRIKLNLSVIVATFFTLGNHDPVLLEVLDEKTLGEMDYVIV